MLADGLKIGINVWAVCCLFGSDENRAIGPNLKKNNVEGLGPIV